MKPKNVEVARLYAFDEITAAEAVELSVPEGRVDEEDERTIEERFESVWAGLESHVDISKNYAYPGIKFTFPNIVWVKAREKPTAYAVSFVLDVRNPDCRGIKAIWEYLPPIYAPAEARKDYRKYEAYNEDYLRKGHAQGLFELIETTFEAYTSESSISSVIGA